MKVLSICLLMIVMAALATAAVPRVFNYQGYVSDLDGTALDGDFDLIFRIYDVDAGADPALWTETHPAVSVSEGVFSVLLGSLVELPPAVLEESELWIGVTVGTDTEIAPRLQVTSTPWAYRAAIADSSAVTGAGGGDGGTVINVATGAGLTGGPITTSGTISIANGGITNSMLGDAVVTGAKIANGSITGADIATNSIEAIDIATSAVTSSEISNYTIAPEDLGANSVTSAAIATGAVGTADIAQNSIIAADIATGAVGADEIATNAVGSSEIMNGSVTDLDILDEPGVAAVADFGSPTLTTTPINVTFKSTNYPATGYIVAIATCYGLTSHTTGTSSEITISLSQTSATHNLNNDVLFFESAAAPSGSYRSPMSTTEVFPVTGSGSTTIYLVADADSGVNSGVFSSNLVLMYFPTAYGGITKADENDNKDFGE